MIEIMKAKYPLEHLSGSNHATAAGYCYIFYAAGYCYIFYFVFHHQRDFVAQR